MASVFSHATELCKEPHLFAFSLQPSAAPALYSPLLETDRLYRKPLQICRIGLVTNTGALATPTAATWPCQTSALDVSARQAQNDADPHLTEHITQKKRYADMTITRTTTQILSGDEVQGAESLRLHALSIPNLSKSMQIVSEDLLPCLLQFRLQLFDSANRIKSQLGSAANQLQI